MRRSCRCWPHLLRKLRRNTTDSSSSDSTYSRRFQLSPHLETDKEYGRKIHSARLPAFCGTRHRARYNDPRSRASSSFGLHRSLSPPRRSARSIWHRDKESVGHQHKARELSGLRLSGAESAATEISKAGALGRLDMREVWLRDG